MTSFLTKFIATGAGAVAIVATLGAATLPAQAGNGGAVAAGVIGGLAAGAIVGSAVTNQGYYNGGPAYAAPVYGPPPGPYGGGCYLQRQPMYDAYGNVVGSRRVRVCE